MTSFETKVLRTIKKNALLTGGERVVAAVSGGPDSVALLIVLLRLQEHLDLQLIAAHANHGLREEESDRDEDFVRDLCRRLGVPLRIGHLDLASARVGNLEDTARQQRYNFLAAVARREGGVLATGHSKNDQAETFLMKLFRGAGPSGLSGIFMERFHPQLQDRTPLVRVVRPLLEGSREEILEYLRSKGEGFREDRSNLELTFDRNWIRRELLPTLEQRMNPKIVNALSRTANLFGEIDEFLTREAECVLARIGSLREGDFVIDIRQLERLPVALQRQVIRLAIRGYKGHLLDITHAHVEAILAQCTGTSGKVIHLPSGLCTIREFDQLRFCPALKPVSPFSYEFDVPGELQLPEVEKRLLVPRVEATQENQHRLLSPAICKMTVRNRRPGDRYQTSIKSPQKNLKKLFLEHKVPISVRDRLLVLECAGRLIWVERMPVGPVGHMGLEESDGLEIEVSSETFDPNLPSNEVKRTK